MEEESSRQKIEYGIGEKWRIIKNILMLGLAFMIHFTAFHGASNLQSSINADEALGTSTLAAIYGSLILSNIFLPAAVIRYLGCKWTVAISFIAYIPFIASQFFPNFYTMIPAGLAVGLGGGPLWCAKCTYLSVAAEAYSQITGIAADVMVIRFFGLFFMFYQFAQVWGNLISSAVLSWENMESNTTFANESIPSYEDVKDICGANFCPGVSINSNPNWNPPSESKIHLISGIYLACMAAACLIVTFSVDSLKRYNRDRSSSSTGLSGLRLLAVTVKQLAQPYQLLILPITMFIGAEQAFMAADFNASFVSCGWGISNIGFVMICFGVANAIAALVVGSVVKITGRSPVVAFSLVLHVCLLVTLLVWKPHPGSKAMFFAIAALWGIADAVWLVQINALTGILFPGKEEASYSNFRLWEATGSVITYALSPYMCTELKIYLLMLLLFVGVLGYAAVEVMENRAKKLTISNRAEKHFELSQN